MIAALYFIAVPFFSILVMFFPAYWLAGLMFREQRLRVPVSTVLLGLIWSVVLFAYYEYSLGPGGKHSFFFGFTMFFTSCVVYVGSLMSFVEVVVRLLRKRRVKAT